MPLNGKLFLHTTRPAAFLIRHRAMFAIQKTERLPRSVHSLHLFTKNAPLHIAAFPHASMAAAVSSASVIISVKELCRSSAVVASPVTRLSEMVQMASALFPARAAFI